MLCACLAALTAIILAISAVRISPPTLTEASHYPTDFEARIASATVSHPNYRYSVVPGGAHSRQELVDAIGRDQVVADHYGAVSLDRVRVERLPEARRAYVSYRVGDRVFWTKHRVTLPAGEPILTDGVKQIRARCGNCISYEPQLPTSDAEPDVLEFEALAPSAPETIPARATHGLVPAAVTPTGPTSLPSPIAELVSQPFSNGTGMADGIVVAPARHKSVVQALVPKPVADGEVPGYEPDDLVLDGSLPEESIAGDSIAGGSIPDGPGDRTVHPPLPGTLIPRPTTGAEELREDDWSQAAPNQPVPVPEPSTLVLLGTGVAGALWRRVRSRRTR